MDGHQAVPAEQAAWRTTGERPTVLNGIFWVLRPGRPWRDRYDKLAANYLAFIQLASIMLLASG
jgi:hypothetical protein